MILYKKIKLSKFYFFLFIKSLKFSKEATDDENLRSAIEILNKYLQVESFRFYFKTNFHVDFEISKLKLKEIKIAFASQEIKTNEDVDCLAWTDRFLDPKFIFINEIFKKRLGHLKISQKKTKKKETEIIIVFISFLLIHELGHLVLRWKGLLDSPKSLGEAGFFLETKLFGGTIHLLITPDKDWNENSECVGIAVNKPYGPRVETKILGFRDYINKIYNMTLSFDTFVNPVIIGKPIEKGVRVMRQKDEEIENEEEPTDYITLESLGILKCGLQKH